MSTLVQVYYAILHSHLQYCNQIWGQDDHGTNSTLLKRVTVFQNFAMRLMSFVPPRTSSNNLYANLEILKFSDMVHCQNILFLHKLFHEKMPVSVQNTFAVEFAHAQFTRADENGLFNFPTINTVSFGNNSIRFNSLNSWNSVQSVWSEKIVSFDWFELKKELKKHFLASYKRQICP